MMATGGRTRGRGRRKDRRAWLLPVLGVAIIGVVAALWTLVHPVDRELGSASSDGDFAEVLRGLAARRQVPGSWIAEDKPIRKVEGVFVRTWRVAAPDRAAANGLASDLVAEASRRGMGFETLRPGEGEIARVRIDVGIEAFDVHLSVKREVAVTTPTATAGKPLPTRVARLTPRPPVGATGRMAILLDDAGQNMDLVGAAANLPVEIGVAVLPFLPASSESALALHRAGHEIWLHLPMEPEGFPEENPGPGAVFVAMPEEEIRTTVHEAIDNIPNVVGVNNHMGSRATKDLRTMTWVMQEIKGRGLAFIDSRTTVDTVAEDAARAQGVPTGRRHVFLDNDRTAAAVRSQLEQAVYRTLMGEEIVAIGHLAPITVEVLGEEGPKLLSRGVTLVPPSAIVN